MRKPLRPHREGPTIVGGGSEVILTVLYNEKESDLLGHPLYVGSAFKIFEVYLHSAVYYKSLEPNEEYQEFLHNSAY